MFSSCVVHVWFKRLLSLFEKQDLIGILKSKFLKPAWFSRSCGNINRRQMKNRSLFIKGYILSVYIYLSIYTIYIYTIYLSTQSISTQSTIYIFICIFRNGRQILNRYLHLKGYNTIYISIHSIYPSIYLSIYLLKTVDKYEIDLCS